MHKNPFRKPAGMLDKATCSAMDGSYGTCMARLSKSEMVASKSGHFWCSKHKKRGELLNWAIERGYPALVFTGATVRHYPIRGLPECIAPMKYAIGVEGYDDNKMLWEVAVITGKDEMIEAAIKHIKQ